MKLINNASQIATRSHSMWSIYLGALALLLPEALYIFAEWDTSPRFWWLLGVGLILYGAIGRLVDQGGSRGKVSNPLWPIARTLVLLVGAAFAITWLSGMTVWDPDKVTPPEAVQIDPGPSTPEAAAPSTDAFLQLAIPYIGEWEGLRLAAYRDIVGVWTVCYGETKGVKPGDTYTKAQCDAMLAREVMSYRTRLHVHFTADTKQHRLPVPRDVAFVSLAYNVGVAGAGKSTAVRRLNAANIAGACEALTWWNKAGGRVVRGLVRRRGADHEMCMRGLA